MCQHQFIIHPRVHMVSCIPGTFKRGIIYQGQSFVTGDLEEIPETKIQLNGGLPWSQVGCSLRRCPGESNSFQQKKRNNKLSVRCTDLLFVVEILGCCGRKPLPILTQMLIVSCNSSWLPLRYS